MYRGFVLYRVGWRSYFSSREKLWRNCLEQKESSRKVDDTDMQVTHKCFPQNKWLIPHPTTTKNERISMKIKRCDTSFHFHLSSHPSCPFCEDSLFLDFQSTRGHLLISNVSRLNIHHQPILWMSFSKRSSKLANVFFKLPRLPFHDESKSSQEKVGQHNML